MVAPSVPATGCAVIFTEAILESGPHGAAPVTVYSKVLEVVPADGVKVPAPALNVPPLPEVCVQTPPELSPVIKLNKLIILELLPQMFILPSVPAVNGALTIT